MSFDEQLRRVFDAAMAELSAGARSDTDRVREEGLEAGRQEGHAKGLEEGRAQGWEDGREQGRFEGRQEAEEAQTAQAAIAAAASAQLAASETGNIDRLLDGIRAIDRARSLGEVLDTLAACGGREASRAAVFLVRGSHLRGWRFIGFDASFADAWSVDAASVHADAIADAFAAHG